jgi:hypothetical protein
LSIDIPKIDRERDATGYRVGRIRIHHHTTNGESAVRRSLPASMA